MNTKQKLLEPILKIAFEPREAISRANPKMEGEEYQDISSPKRRGEARNHPSKSRNGFFRWVLILALFIFSAFLLTAPFLAHAQEALEKLKTVGGEAYGVAGEPKSIAEIVGGIISAALGLLGIGAVILMLYGGYLWLTARGKEERVTKAKDTIEAAIIGLIIILAAYTISYYVVKWVSEAAQ
jgi:hypothetical protein